MDFIKILRDYFSVEIYKKIFGIIFWGILVERFNILQMELRWKPNFTAGNCWTNAIHGANFISTLNYEHVYMWMFSPVTEKPAHHELMNGRDYWNQPRNIKVSEKCRWFTLFPSELQCCWVIEWIVSVIFQLTFVFSRFMDILVFKF